MTKLPAAFDVGWCVGHETGEADERVRIVEIVKARARRARDRGDISVASELWALANEIGAES